MELNLNTETQKKGSSPSDAILYVGIADIKTGSTPQKIKTNLGSCIGVCLYSAKEKIGGMLHFMLASARMDLDSGRGNLKKEKYADTGIPEIISLLQTKYGIAPKDLTAKIFGGAKVLANVTSNIGGDNEAKAKEILQEAGIKIVATKTGGQKGYNIEFDLNTGKVKCQIFGQPAEEF